MSLNLPRKKKMLIGIPTILVTGGILVTCWILFSEKVFFLVLISLAVLGVIADHLVKKHERRRNSLRL
jgi:hypothetical protein